MLTPRARVSVAKTVARRFWMKQSSTISRNAGTIPAWWAAIPRRNESMKSAYSSARRSSSEKSRSRASAMRSISRRCSGVVKSNPSRRHWRTASSQAAREKMNTMTGNRSSRSSACRSSLRRGARNGAGGAVDFGPCQRGPGRKRRVAFIALSIRRASSDNRSPSRRSTTSAWGCPRRTTARCWCRVIGRSVSVITAVSPRSSSNHLPTKGALPMVAERATKRTAEGVRMSTSSHTPPRKGS